MQQKTFVEVQGYLGDTKQCQPYSGIQGGKLSGQFFGVYTLETTAVGEIMNEKEEIKFITGEDNTSDAQRELQSLRPRGCGIRIK